MGTVDNSFKDAVIELLSSDEYDHTEDAARNAVHNAARNDPMTFYRNTSEGTAIWVNENPDFWDGV